MNHLCSARRDNQSLSHLTNIQMIPLLPFLDLSWEPCPKRAHICSYPQKTRGSKESLTWLCQCLDFIAPLSSIFAVHCLLRSPIHIHFSNIFRIQYIQFTFIVNTPRGLLVCSTGDGTRVHECSVYSLYIPSADPCATLTNSSSYCSIAFYSEKGKPPWVPPNPGHQVPAGLKISSPTEACVDNSARGKRSTGGQQN